MTQYEFNNWRMRSARSRSTRIAPRRRHLYYNTSLKDVTQVEDSYRQNLYAIRKLCDPDDVMALTGGIPLGPSIIDGHYSIPNAEDNTTIGASSYLPGYVVSDAAL